MDSYDFAGPSTLLKDSTTIQCQIGRYEAIYHNCTLVMEPNCFTKKFYSGRLYSYNLNDESGELFNKALVADTTQVWFWNQIILTTSRNQTM